MKVFLLLPVLFLFVFGLLYILYINGIGVINSKAALLYQGCPRVGKNKNRLKAKFVSCRGTTKRVILLQPGRVYQFAFSSAVTKGAVWVEIQDKQKDRLWTLDQQHSCARISVEGGGRLYVTTRFAKADGEYELAWKIQE